MVARRARTGEGGGRVLRSVMRRAVLALVLVLAALAGAQELPPGWERTEQEGVVLERLKGDPMAGAVLALFRDSRAAVEDRLGAKLGQAPIRAIVAPSTQDFVLRVHDLAGRTPDANVLAIAIPGRRAIVVDAERLRLEPFKLESTLKHELSHLLLAQVARGTPLPRWFDEGVAELAAGVELARPEVLELAGAARWGSLESLDELSITFPGHGARATRAYRTSLSFVTWLDRRAQAEGGLRAIVQELDRRTPLDRIVAMATGVPLADAEALWRRELAQEHSIPEALARSGTVWLALLPLLFVVVYVVERRRRRKVYERLEE